MKRRRKSIEKNTTLNTDSKVNIVQSPLLFEDTLDEIVTDKKYHKKEEVESKTSIYIESKAQNIQVENLTRTTEASNCSLINYSDIQFDKLKNIVVSYDGKLHNCKNNNLFIEFCHFTIGLLEE
ncbi:MAG: hypothetical protein AB1589_12085, partial [Cyanobacteriota bacterium]